MSSAMISPRFTTFKLAEQSVTQRGAKFCTLSNNGAKVTLFPAGTESIVCPFGPGNFEKNPEATRQTLELPCNQEMCLYFDQFDLWAKGYLFEHSERLFGKALTQLQIEEGYHPTLKRSENGTYAPNLRTKIDTKGRREISYWTPEGVKRGPPEDWNRVTVIPALELCNFWIMSRELGWVIQCTALKV